MRCTRGAWSETGSSLKRIQKRLGIRAYNYSIGTTSGIVDLRFVTHRLSNGSMVCARFNFVWRLHPWRLIIEFIIRVPPPTRSSLSSDIRRNKSRRSPWRPRVPAFEFIHFLFLRNTSDLNVFLLPWKICQLRSRKSANRG